MNQIRIKLCEDAQEALTQAKLDTGMTATDVINALLLARAERAEEKKDGTSDTKPAAE